MASLTQPMQRPAASSNPLLWLRRNLLNNWYNALLTLAGLYLLWLLGSRLVAFVLSANWAPILASPLLYLIGQYPVAELWRVGASLLSFSLLLGLSWGAWGGIVRTFAWLALGLYAALAFIPWAREGLSAPIRVFMLAAAAVVLAGFALGRRPRLGRAALLVPAWLLSLGLVYWLLRGVPGVQALPVIQTTSWGGLMVNLLLAAVGILASFPLGVLLALGRRST
ncbi:MAG: amino acid ABC transporter permease, partial [Candidatus Promineifilaceae bacterium]